MKKNKLFIISIVTLIMLVSVSSLFATAKPSTKNYGVYSETIAGAVIDVPGDDGIGIYPWDGTISLKSNIEISTATPEFLLDDYDYSATNYSDYNDYNNTLIEGRKYLRFLYGTAGWVGLGFTRLNGGKIDMSNYAGGKVKFFARSMSSGTVKNTKILFQTESLGDNLLGTLDAITSDWKEFEFNIPNNVDLSDVTSLFVILQNQNVHDGDDLDIDNVRWERDEVEEIDVTGVNFSADLQNGSGNKITWYTDGTDVSTARNAGWKVANEYINLRITKFLDKDNNEYPIGNGKSVSSYPFSSSSLSKWKFRIYTSSKTATKDGLLPYKKENNKFVYCEDLGALSLCWRLVDSELTNFVINETDDHKHLYEGDNDEWYCWLYIQNRGSDDYNKGNYAIMWNNSDGFRGSEGDYYGGPNGFDVSPKLYIGANFKNAAGDLKYESVIVIECYDE